MLRELHISNLAVIEDLHVEFRSGLNVITGPTGAGKSLVLSAFDMLLGRRMTTTILRPGAGEGRVTGLFEINDPEVSSKIYDVADLPVSDTSFDDEPLILTRKISSNGRSGASIDGQAVTISMLRETGRLLIDVHQQSGRDGKGGGGSKSTGAARPSDSVHLLQPGYQLEVLDAFASLGDLRTEYHRAYVKWRELEQTYQDTISGRDLRAERLDLYHFQADEIDTVDPVAGEYEELKARFRILSNLERLTREVETVHSALYESDGSIVSRLQAMVAVLRDLVELDDDLGEVLGLTEQSTAALQEASFDIGRYLSRLELDPNELVEVTDRLNSLNRLIAKYGGPQIEDVIGYRQKLEREIESLSSVESDSDQIRERLDEQANALRQMTARLHTGRQAAVKRLVPLVHGELTDLALPDVVFDVDIQETDTFGPTGSDRVEMLVQTNPNRAGENLKPLRDVASGGELSRLLLALESILAQTDRVSVLVFDEIDAKVGGRLGTVLGRKLRALAERHQVLCITHLPQIAAFADHHLKITKKTEKGETRTSVTPLLEEDERLAELAEMLTGQAVTDVTLAQARELRNQSNEDREIPMVQTKRMKKKEKSK